MAEARLSSTPSDWLDALARSLADVRGEILAQMVATVRALPLPKGGHAGLKAALLAVGSRTDVPPLTRLAALEATGGVPAVDQAALRHFAFSRAAR